MAKFRVETQLAVAKGGGDAVKTEFQKVSDGARQASIDVKDLTKSIGAGISVFAIARSNLQALAPVMERNGQLFKDFAVSLGANEGAVKGMTLAMDSLIHPSHIIQNAIEATAIGSKKLQEAWVGETNVILNLSKAQLQAVDNYLAMGGAAGAFARAQEKAAKEQQEIGETLERLLAQQLRDEERLKDVRKQAYEEYKRSLQAVMDRLNPIAAAERDLGEQIALVNQALAAGGPNAQLYEQALASLRAELAALTAVAELVPESIPLLEVNPRTITGGSGTNPFAGGTITISQSPYVEEMMRAEEQFSENLAQGMGAAAASFARDFLETGELNIQALGDMLLDVLLDAAMQYFAQMVANQAKLKVTSGAAGATGAGGMNAGMSALGNVAMAAAVVYAVYAITDGIRKANDAGKLKETAAAGVYRGGVGSTYAGELAGQGRQMAEALRGFLNLMQSVAGSWITSMGEIGVRVSGDGKKFQALVAGEIVGTFSSMSEAMVRAFQASFSTATFAGEIDPIIRDMVTNFRGTDIEELKAGLQQVKSVLDEVSGLSEIEIALKDLPFQADAFKQSLVQLGASFDDASALAAKWQATQMGNLRDQITGHQATEAEQRAQKEREALLFNAQLALNKAEIQMKRDKLAADIAILKAGGSLATADLNLTTQYLGQVGRLTDVKAELLNRDLQIQQGHVNLMTAAGQAALAALQLQLAALDQVMAILGEIKPIDLAEIRIGGGRGGGRNAPTGPTPEEIAAEAARAVADFNREMTDLARSIIPGVSGQIRQLNAWYAEQAARAAELGIPLGQLNDIYAQQFLNLQNETLASLGLQSVETAQQFSALREALKYLRDWGMLTEAQLRELGDTMYISLVDSLLQYVDNEEVRQQLEDLRFRMEMANYELQFQMLISLGLLTQAEIDVITGLLAGINEAYLAGELDFQMPERRDRPNRPQDNRDEARERALDALRQALDRLRNAVEGLREFQEGLTLSSASPLTTSQQFDEAARQYAELLARAQAGDVGAMEELAAAAQRYLDLAAQMYGTSGAGYAAIFDLVSQQIAAIVAAGQAILDAAPAQMQGTEDRLDTTNEILAEIRRLFGGRNPSQATGNLPTAGNAGNFRSLGSSGNLSMGNFASPGTITVRDPELVAQVRALTEAQIAATTEAKADRMKKPAVGLSGFYGTPIGGKRSA